MQCWDALVASDYLATLSPRSQAILRKVLRGNNGICSRALAFDHRRAFNEGSRGGCDWRVWMWPEALLTLSDYDEFAAIQP